MNYMPANSRLFRVLIAASVLFLSFRVLAGVQEDFFWAVDNGNLSQVAQLLKKGANLDLPNNEGYTPLMVAARISNLPLVQLLIDAGASLNLRNNYGETAIMLASYHGQAEMVRFFYSKGAEINHDGWNPLLYAATNGHVETIRLLLGEKVDINATSDNGTTALMMAVRGNHIDAVALLLNSGANPRIKNEHGENALHWAQKRDYQHIVKLLERQGVSE